MDFKCELCKDNMIWFATRIKTQALPKGGFDVLELKYFQCPRCKNRIEILRKLKGDEKIDALLEIPQGRV